MMPDSVWSLLSELSVSQSDFHFPLDNCLAFLSYCTSTLMSPRLGCLLRDKKFSLLILPFLLLSLCWPSHILKGLECFCCRPAGRSASECSWPFLVSVWVGQASLGKINGSRSSADRTDGLQGVRWTRAGTCHWAAGQLNLSWHLIVVCRMPGISSRWKQQLLSLLPSELCSWQVLKPAE